MSLKSNGFALSDAAKLDLMEIWSFIAEDNPRAATKFTSTLLRHCGAVAAMPKMGAERPDILPGLRSHPYKRYLILYRERPRGGIFVLRVFGPVQDVYDIDLV